MASSETAICNLALSHIGISQEIANVETERSKEAAACRRFYDETRDKTLRDFPWPFANKTRALSLVEENPNDEWDYSYRYPSDCARAIRILSGFRNDNRQSRVPYKIGKDDDGLLIYTDTEDAELEYTEQIEDVTLFPSDFVMALSFLLAGYIAPRLTGGDPFKLGARALELYRFELNKAGSNASSEQQDEEHPESEFIRTRE